jgi:hypothetical protein
MITETTRLLNKVYKMFLVHDVVLVIIGFNVNFRNNENKLKQIEENIPISDTRKLTLI